MRGGHQAEEVGVRGKGEEGGWGREGGREEMRRERKGTAGGEETNMYQR